VGKRLLRWFRAALGIAVLIWLVRALARNWSELQAQRITWSLNPIGLLASALLVWAMYALLIEAWRLMLRGWGQHIGGWNAARIWTVSSLGKYVPGKVWAVTGMALMARDVGVSPAAATASAILLQALAIGSGALVAGLAGTSALERSHPGISAGFWALAGVSGAAVVALLWPPVTRRVARIIAGPIGSAPSPLPILFGLLANLVSWVGYGAALWELARSTLGAPHLTLAAAVGSFAASYVAGLLFLLAPGGLGVREGVMVLMLQEQIGWPTAAGLAVASRLLLTVTEVGAALPFLLLHRESPRVRA
jgi:glycosyltransferase 2 family protein